MSYAIDADAFFCAGGYVQFDGIWRLPGVYTRSPLHLRRPASAAHSLSPRSFAVVPASPPVSL